MGVVLLLYKHIHNFIYDNIEFMKKKKCRNNILCFVCVRCKKQKKKKIMSKNPAAKICEKG